MDYFILTENSFGSLYTEKVPLDILSLFLSDNEVNAEAGICIPELAVLTGPPSVSMDTYK